VTAKELLKEIRAIGSEQIKKILMNHGASEPVVGAKIEDMKKILKREKVTTDYKLALELYDTGVYDAMYLAGLIADDAAMTKKDLEHWVDKAYCYGLAEYTVAWVASEGRFGSDMARKWIESKKELVAAAGWSTLSSLVSIRDDASLDIPGLGKLLDRVAKTIHSQPNRVRYTMNGFVIAAGSYVPALTDKALDVAKKIGVVSVNVGDTACKVPDAASYIRKVADRGKIGSKRKTAKC